MKTSLFPGIPKAIRKVLTQSNGAFHRETRDVLPDTKGTSHKSNAAANSLDETCRLLPGLIHASRT